ncbi:Aste57867_4368 [Aphanomyces stellatus]|uniref:Aste57867_4368 protein n=1 Tax=Aphanomyces stellatus TaxID=120398 RepID=A0A485KBB6_9STRA|nr:hypothetical protein As57867_004356 [Aphanomyces stellatus]VFT81482.1 Aste57867_4368 [Aphanomyces stellatus]
MGFLALGRRLAVFLTVVATAEAQKSTNCPYTDLPVEVTGIRVWDEVLCSSQSLAWFDMCIVDKACVQLPNTTTYDAVGDISKSRSSSFSTWRWETKAVDFSKAVFPDATTSMEFAGIANFSLQSVFPWPKNLTKILFKGIANFSLPSTFQWPNTVTQMYFIAMSNFSLPPTFQWPQNAMHIYFMDMDNASAPLSWPSTMEELTLRTISNMALLSTFPPTLTKLCVFWAHLDMITAT